MKDNDVKKAFENRLVIADGSLQNEINYIANQIEEQSKLFSTKCIIQDIIDAYNGELEWNEYLKQRIELNENIKVTNNNKIIKFQNDKDEYKIEYHCELPILDYTSFYIAQKLGKMKRGEK